MIKVSFLVALIVLFTACIATQSTFKGIEISKDNVQVSNSIDLTKYVDSSYFVKLETKQNCLIGTIKDIQFAANKIFILNSIAGDNEILVFNIKGRFINKIGTKGNGPSEYLSLNSFCINTFKNYIILFDSYKGKIHKYDYAGNYLESHPIKTECGSIIKSRFISKNRIICVNGINHLTSTLIFECDENFNDMNVVLSSDLKAQGLYEYAKDPITAASGYFLKPLSNTVYQYDEKGSNPAFEIDLNVKDYNPEAEMTSGGDYGKLLLSSLQKGFYPLSGIFEDNKYLLFVQNGYFTLWNKKLKTGVSSACALYPDSKNILPFSDCSVIGVFENKFVCLLSDDYFSEIKKIYTINNIHANSKVGKLLSEHNVEDNPTIAFYHFK